MAGLANSSGRAVDASRERRFYTRMGWFIAALVLIGFGPSFYIKPLGLSYPRPNPELAPSVMLHGLVFTAWVGVFLTQVSLVSAGRRDLHRALGMAGMALGALMVPVMYLTAVWAVARETQPPFTDPLTWTVVPLIGIPVFAAMLWLGWRASRRDLQAHKRLMLGIMIMFTQPAIARIPIAPPNLSGFAFQALLSWLVFVPLFLWDRRTIGQLHWATRLGAGLFAAISLAQVFFLATPGIWSSLAAHLPGVN